MAYGTTKVDVIQSSTANVPVQFNDGNGTQTGTLCRAWVNFNGSTAVINASFNVGSITKNATGDYTLNITNALADANYALIANNRTSVANSARSMGGAISRTTTAARFQTTYVNVTGGAGVTFDDPQIDVAIFR